jgi:hypothetical protein
VIVKSDGTAAANGAALLAAVTGLSAPSAANTYLVKLDAGTFDLPSTLTLPAGVALEGSGQEVTTVTRTGVGAGIILDSPGAVRDLTVTTNGTNGANIDAIRAVGGGAMVIQDVRLSSDNTIGGARAVFQSAGNLELHHVVAGATSGPSGAAASALRVFAGVGFTISNSQLTASSVSNAYAIQTDSPGRIQTSDVSAGAAGGDSFGVRLDGGKLLIAGSSVGGQDVSLSGSGTVGAEIDVANSLIANGSVGSVVKCINSFKADFATPTDAACN